MAVAVITPYRAQVASIKDALKPMLDRSAEARRDGGASPHVGTIHTFQGSERDVVILDLVENRGETIGLLFLEESGDRLGNVAITRAKGKLVVLADPRAFIDAAGHRSVWQLRSIIAGLERTSRVPYEEIRNGVPL
jgi:superfamily I DNA and/or RNA helicase